jgi:hypothetical protein
MDGNFPAHPEPSGHFGISGKGARQILIDKKMIPYIVGKVVSGTVHGSRAGDILGNRPVFHFVAFTVTVVPQGIIELDAVRRRKEAGSRISDARLHCLGLDAIVRWDDTTVRNIEADTVHAQFIVYKNVVGILWTVEIGVPSGRKQVEPERRRRIIQFFGGWRRGGVHYDPHHHYTEKHAAKNPAHGIPGM